MNSVLLSIQPQWCELIASGKKTIEVRKTKPKLDTPFKCYIYCTKDKNKIFWYNKLYRYIDERSHNLFDKPLNGKVIGEFVCDEIIMDERGEHSDILCKNGCCTLDELKHYGHNRILYGWHISDLIIYDKPRELREFYVEDTVSIKKCKYRFRTGQPEYVTRHGGWIKGSYTCMKSGEPEWCENCITKPLTRPPQSWCYIASPGGECL